MEGETERKHCFGDTWIDEYLWLDAHSVFHATGSQHTVNVDVDRNIS